MYIHEEIQLAVLPLLKKYDLELIELIGEMNHAACELMPLNQNGLKRLHAELKMKAARGNMTSFFLTLEAQGGSDLSACAFDAISLATKINVTILFDFNGVKCMACPGDDAKALADDCLRVMKIEPNSTSHLIARGRPSKKGAEA